MPEIFTVHGAKKNLSRSSVASSQKLADAFHRKRKEREDRYRAIIGQSIQTNTPIDSMPDEQCLELFTIMDALKIAPETLVEDMKIVERHHRLVEICDPKVKDELERELEEREKERDDAHREMQATIKELEKAWEGLKLAASNVAKRLAFISDSEEDLIALKLKNPALCGVQTPDEVTHV